MKIKECCKGLKKNLWGEFNIDLFFKKDMIPRFQITKEHERCYWEMEITHCPFCGKKLRVEKND